MNVIGLKIYVLLEVRNLQKQVCVLNILFKLKNKLNKINKLKNKNIYIYIFIFSIIFNICHIDVF